MEELKILVGMVSELPTMAIWVIIFYFIYKVIIVGSIYGVIKLGVRKLHDVLIKKKEGDTIVNEHYWDLADRISISDDTTKEILAHCLRRMVGKGTGINTSYIHLAGAQWLQEAINEKEQREENNDG